MALTRRTERFRVLALETERLCARASVIVPSLAVDALLNAHVETPASLMDIGMRAALNYAPDDLPGTVAGEIAAALEMPPDGDSDLERGAADLT